MAVDSYHSIVVLMGIVGHGKSFITNKICGTNFLSAMHSRSCTTELQYGYNEEYRLKVYDTPGFGSVDDIDKHILGQRLSLESENLSGLYVVVKLARDDEMCQTINRVMDFAGTDDVNIIITFVDKPEEQNGDDSTNLKDRLSGCLDVPSTNILVIGKNSAAKEILDFIQLTMRNPFCLVVSKEQLAYASNYSQGSRKTQREVFTPKSNDGNSKEKLVDTKEESACHTTQAEHKSQTTFWICCGTFLERQYKRMHSLLGSCTCTSINQVDLHLLTPNTKHSSRKKNSMASSTRYYDVENQVLVHDRDGSKCHLRRKTKQRQLKRQHQQKQQVKHNSFLNRQYEQLLFFWRSRAASNPEIVPLLTSDTKQQHLYEC